MGRITANDRAKTDHRIEPFRPRQGPRHKRYFKRPGHAHDLDILRHDTVFRERFHAAAQQLTGDKLVELRDDDPELQTRRVVRAFTKFHLFFPTPPSVVARHKNLQGRLGWSQLRALSHPPTRGVPKHAITQASTVLK